MIGAAVVGIGQGSAPKNDPAPTGATLVASKKAVASGGPKVQKGKEEFSEEGCNRCHALAATGAKGKLGPRMDTQDDPVAVVEENITEPHKDIAEGFEAHLMPTDYATRLGKAGVADVAAFIKAASVGAKG